MVGDGDVLAPEGPDAPAVRSGDLPTRLAGSARWLAYLLLAGLFLIPILDTTVVADDYVAPYAQHDRVGFSYLSFLRWMNGSIGTAGHFNYLGQYVGGAYNMLWLWVSDVTRTSMQSLYTATKVAVIVGAALAGARLIRVLAEAYSIQIKPWTARCLVSVALFSTLQVHIWWSNDPVASFPMSGFAPAALGLLFLAEVVRAWRSPSPLRTILVGLFGAACVLYYELNVASVLAGFALLLWLTVSLGEPRRRLRRLLRLAPVIGIPAVITLGLQLRASPGSENYEGTAVAAGSGLLHTAWITSLSSLPAAAWRLTRTQLAGAPGLPAAALAILFIVTTGVGVWAWRARGSAPRHPIRVELRFLGAVTTAGVTLWLGATTIQASTAKIQAEVVKVGQVYSFYAFGAVGIALVLAAVGRLLLDGRVPVPAGIAMISAFALFTVAQYGINWELAERFNAATAPNRTLAEVFTNEASEPERCDALRAWTAGPWPEYYEVWMVDGLDSAYQDLNGEPFCTDPSAGPQL